MRIKKFDKLLQTWISKATDDKIAAVAEQTGLDKADVTRLLLREGLKHGLSIEQAVSE